MRSQLDTVLPPELVLRTAREFLVSCDWQLELDEDLLAIPPESQLLIRSRAFIAGELDDVFLGDHLEAVVLVGVDDSIPNLAKYAQLKLYFTMDGQFVSEDRYSPTA
jgi:hypothetical protein